MDGEIVKFRYKFIYFLKNNLLLKFIVCGNVALDWNHLEENILFMVTLIICFSVTRSTLFHILYVSKFTRPQDFQFVILLVSYGF